MKLHQVGIELDGTGAVPWSEIVALHVTEVDTMTGSVTILQLEHESGHYLEIHELDNTYSTALQELASFLRLDEDWTSMTKGLEAGTSATIWRRS